MSFCWSLAWVYGRSLVISVRQKELVKDVTVCSNIQMSVYKQHHLDDTEDPQDVGLSSEDEITGMVEQLGVSRRIIMQSLGTPTPSRGRALLPAPEGEPTGDPVPAPQPSLPEGYVKIGPDEVVIRKGILRGIKRGAELALKGGLPASFSAGSATAGDVPFRLDPRGEDDVYCSLCRKDLSNPRALRRHLRIHLGKTRNICKRCGKHLASKKMMAMHEGSCGSVEYMHNCTSCGKGYHSKQALLQHLKVHQGQAPIEDRTCPDCREVFNLVKTMREHRAVHRGPYPCPVEGCPASFSLPKRRNRHLRDRHGFDAKRF